MEEAKEPAKPWERPWTTEEMRQQSGNWNLAGDAGLLKHLQEFSQNLIARTHATEVALDSLMEELRATSTNVSNVTNQFLCLANTQFVENRVYDDDEKETPPEEKKEEEKPKSKEEQEAEVVARVREALALGISVLDTMFDAVEVPASDSEDEESGGRVVLEPHNPYLSRPLPYLIGSRQFMEDDNVGLGSQSDSEETGADKNMAQSSESESDMDIEEKEVPKKRTRFSSTSASDNSDFVASDNSDLGPGPGKHKKIDNSGLFGNVPPADTGNMFGGDSPTDEIGVVDSGAVKRDSFAAELAAKLGGVATEPSLPEQNPTKIKNSASKPSMVWEDEDDDDGLFGRRDGKYSGGRGLFDDLEDSPGSLWNTKEKSSDKGTAVKQPSLFGPDTENEEGIFSGGTSKDNQDAKKRILSVPHSGIATSTPITDSGFVDEGKNSNLFNATKKSTLFDADLSDNLFDGPSENSKNAEKTVEESQQSESKKKKKPVGGVSMFGSVDVFSAGIRKPPPSSSSSSDESEQQGNKAFLFNSSQPISSIAKNSTEPNITANSKVTSGEFNKVSLFDGDDDNLFDPIVPTSQNIEKKTAVESGNIQPATSSLFQDDNDEANDSLFGKPQKGSMKGSMKAAAGGSSATKQASSSKKATSLFNDSDSGDDELLFSSTSSASSRSRRSQGSGDLLAASGDKVKPPVVQKKGLFDEDALFGGLQDDPGFDIFSTGTTAVKPSPRNLGDGDLFGEAENNIFQSSTSNLASQDKLKNGTTDALFDDDIFGKNSKSQKNVDKGIDVDKSIPVKASHAVISASKGLFSDDPLDDIFAIPVNVQKKRTSEEAVKDNLFSGDSALISDVDDLFSEPLKSKQDNKDIPKNGEFSDQTDDIFSIPKNISSVRITANNETISKDSPAVDTNPSTKNENLTNVAEILTEQNDVKSSDLFKVSQNKSDSDLFSKSAADSSVSKKPVIPSKPVIKQKPKLPPTSKTSPEDSDVFSSLDKNKSQNSSNTSTKERTAEKKVLIEKSESSESEKLVSLPEPNSLISTSVAEPVGKPEIPSVKPSPKPTKLEPPKTLNIRKTTGLLFSSSSNEDEDLFGLGFPSKASSNLSSVETLDNEKVTTKPTPQDDKPKLFSTDKRSKSEKEISSKLNFSQDNVGGSIVKARSVGASPRQLNIDPSALLPGAKPPPRGLHNAERAVSFDHPAQLTATLHSAGKERARIQAKRRPPSRKARQEAVRKSGIDFEDFEAAAGVTSKSLSEETNSLPVSNLQISSDDVQSPSEITSTKENASNFIEGRNNTLLSPSTDEEDLFGVPQDLPAEYETGKDDGKSLFSSAPVLSPLEFKSESLPIFPEDVSSSETPASNAKDPDSVEPKAVIPQNPLDVIPSHSDNILSSDDILDDRNDVYDTFRNQPPLDDFDDEDDDDDSSDLFSISKKKITPLKKESNLFESAKESGNLFSTLKSSPKTEILDQVVSSNSGDVRENNKTPKNDPLLFHHDDKPIFQNIPRIESSDELFSSGSVEKSSGDLFRSKKSEKVDNDLFLPSKSDKNSTSYVVEDDLFSTSTRTSVNKDTKTRSSVEKNPIVSKHDDNVGDSLFSSAKQNQFPSPEDDLFSGSNVKDKNPQKTATPEKKINSDLFGSDSHEADDLFFSSSKKKVGISGKVKSSTVPVTSAKGSLFDEDEDDDIFGGSVKSHSSNKPATVPIDNEGPLFGSSSTRKKSRGKVTNSTTSSSSRQATKKDDLFEDPLMVVTKK